MQILNAKAFKRRIRKYHSLPYFAEKSANIYKERSFQYGHFNSTFKSLYDQATTRAGFWTRSEKQHVGIDLPSTENLGLIQLSALLAGKVPVFFPHEMGKDEKESVIEEFDLDCILSTSAGALHFRIEDYHVANGKVKSKILPTDLAAIFYEQTSDSWRPLPLTHENFLANIRGFMHVFKQPNKAKLFNAFELNSSYGIVSGFWVPYFFGISTFSLSEEETIENAWDKSEINSLFSEAPYVEGLEEKLSNSQWAQLDYLIMGTIPLRGTLVEKIAEHNTFISRSLGVPGGGFTVAMNTPNFEVTAISGGKPFEQQGNKEGSFGRPLPGLAAKITDTDGNELDGTSVGTIWLYGAGLCDTYKNDKGWLNTNVKGYIDEQGFLFVN